MSPDSNQIQISASSRGITDYFFCFVCDASVWDCEHLIEERLRDAERFFAHEPSPLDGFAYKGTRRILEVIYRVTAPFVHDGEGLPPPAHVIQFFNVPRYVFDKLVTRPTARAQERYFKDHIQRGYRCQTVRTVCRLPRIYRFVEARNVRRHPFDDYLTGLSRDEQQALPLVVAAMKAVLLRTLAPKRVAGLGGLMECQSCGAVGATVAGVHHRNCLWFALT